MTDTRYVGVKEEATFGTEATGSSLDLTDGLASMSLDAPKDPNIILPTLSRFEGKHVPGFYSPDGSMEYTLDVHTIGWFLKWGLGGYTYTAGATQGTDFNTHEFYAVPGYTPKSFTTRVGKDTFEHVFVGCVLNKFEVSMEDGLGTLKTDLIAQKDSKASLRSSLNTPDPDLYPLAFYNTTNKINSVDLTNVTQKWGLNFDNGMKAEEGQAFGSRFPYFFRRGGAAIELGVTVRDDSTTYLESLWGSSTGPINTASANFPVETKFDSSTFGNMTVSLPNCYYKETPTDVKGSDPRTPDLSIGVEKDEITLEDGTTKVTSPILITLLNYETEYKVV